MLSKAVQQDKNPIRTEYLPNWEDHSKIINTYLHYFWG